MTQTAQLKKVIDYVNAHPTGVLGTTTRDGTPHGAVVYFYADTDGKIYFFTKNETAKYDNILNNHNVSVTIFDAEEESTLQATGEAHVFNDPAKLDKVLKAITGVQATAKSWLPPISKIRAGSYNALAITLTEARIAHYGDANLSGANIFTTYRAGH